MRTVLVLLLLVVVALRPALAQGFPDSLDLKLGQMILIGINDRTGLQPSDPLVAELQRGKIGGVVLFEKNIARTGSADSLRKLTHALQQYAASPLLISIDEEGGKVHRLKEKYGFFPVPSAAYLGRLDNADTTLFYHRKLAALLASLGINFNYAPSLDLAVNPANTVIVRNERSFGRAPGLVARQAALCIQAHHENGVKTIVKHFPGHGSSNADSHLGLVDVTQTWQLEELLPYDTLLRSRIPDAVMTAHIINRRWDPDLLPATLSEKTVTGLLRNLLGFQGVVFSDDLQMQAISDHYGLENAIRLAVNAGVDVLLFANTLPKEKDRVTATQIHAILKKLVAEQKIPAGRIDAAFRRIQALKAKKV